MALLCHSAVEQLYTAGMTQSAQLCQFIPG